MEVNDPSYIGGPTKTLAFQPYLHPRHGVLPILDADDDNV